MYHAKIFLSILVIVVLAIPGCSERVDKTECELYTPKTCISKKILCISRVYETGSYEINNNSTIKFECSASEVEDQLNKLDDEVLALGILLRPRDKAKEAFELEDMLKTFCIRKNINFYEEILYSSMINPYFDVLVWADKGESKKHKKAANIKTIVMPGMNATLDVYCITRVNDDSFKIPEKTYSKKELDQYLQDCDENLLADGIMFETGELNLDQKSFQAFEKIIKDSYSKKNVDVFIGMATTDPHAIYAIWLTPDK